MYLAFPVSSIFIFFPNFLPKQVQQRILKKIPSFYIILSLLFLLSDSYSQKMIHVQNDSHGNVISMVEGQRVTAAIPSSTDEIISPKENGAIELPPTSFPLLWTLKYSVPGKVFKDVSFADSQTGYIVAELGAVYKTTNGGDTWVAKMNLGFPYYWYGVHALSPDTLIISGFNNQGDIHSGVVRWSYDGGDSWTSDIILRIPNGVGWTTRVHFFNPDTGIVMAEFSGGVHYTTNGGKDTLAWNYVQVNSDLGWFAGNIDAQASGHVFATGIHFARSANYGFGWMSGPSADNVFDGGVDVLDDDTLKGWTGGGQISQPVSGWVHRTTDGGATWSPRLHDFPYPIRAVKFFNDTLGFAIGGDLYQEEGGIYSTTDAGTTWNLDINTGAEMFSLAYQPTATDSVDI